MKKSGKCPKCGGTKLKIGQRSGQGGIILGWFTSVRTDAYLCCGCGYVEEYATEKHLRNTLQK